MIKRLITLIIIFMGLYYIYDNNYFGSQQFVRDVKREVHVPASNQYVKTNVNLGFVQETTDFLPDNRQELLNIYYTAINTGWDEFTFYCHYKECIDDVNKLSVDSVLLSNLNSFVDTYNSYSTISTYTTPLFNEKVKIVITRTYNTLMIEKINNEINKIYDSLILPTDSTVDKIRKIHDYIINHTKYDALKISNINDATYHSNTAYGPLFEGYAVCSGYADVMALFLDKMNIPNIKVASETHVWNLVYIDNKWLHLDLTWDDPYVGNNEDVINHNFFLINYNKLKQWNSSEHAFDTSIYKEATE